MKSRILISILLLATLGWSFVSSPKAKKEEVVLIHTSYGDIYLWLYKDTPIHRDNFIKLAKEKFYDGTTFHRVIKDFMIQGGDPYSKMEEKKDSVGEGGAGYTLPAEFNRKHFHKRGALAAAREGDNHNPEKRSSSSQFYIVTGTVQDNQDLMRNEKRVQTASRDTSFHFNETEKQYYTTIGGTPWLDRTYTVFGEVISGMEVVDKIGGVEKIGNVPKTPIPITVEIVKFTPEQLKKKFFYVIPD